jgi:hypothetical protein
MTMTRLNDVQRVERAIAVCVGLDLGAPLFAALENDLAMLRARDRALASAALLDAIAREPDGDDWSCVPCLGDHAAAVCWWQPSNQYRRCRHRHACGKSPPDRHLGPQLQAPQKFNNRAKNITGLN